MAVNSSADEFQVRPPVEEPISPWLLIRQPTSSRFESWPRSQQNKDLRCKTRNRKSTELYHLDPHEHLDYAAVGLTMRRGQVRVKAVNLHCCSHLGMPHQFGALPRFHKNPQQEINMNTDYPLSTHVDIAPYSGRRKVPARVLWLQAIVLIAFAAMQGLVSRTWAAEMPKLRFRDRQDPMRIASSRIRTGSRSSWPASARRTSSKRSRSPKINSYFKARHDQGFNAAWVMVSGSDHYAKPPMLTGTGYSLENNVHDVAGNAIKVDPAESQFRLRPI